MNLQQAHQNKTQSLPLIHKLQKEHSISPTTQVLSLDQRRQMLPLHRRVEIFLCSFLAFTSVHALRTTYSFSKSYLPDEIGMQEKLIGIVDSVMLLFIGLGNFLIAIRPFSRPIRAVWLALLFCALQFCLVPVSMKNMYGSGAFAVLVILMGLSGYLQSFMWPNLLPLVHSVWSPDKDTTLLGFWATCPNFGNILGFVVCQLIVLNNGLSWEVSMFIIATYMAMNAIYIAVRVDQMPVVSEESMKVKGEHPLLSQSAKSDDYLESIPQRTSEAQRASAASWKQYSSSAQGSPSVVKVFKDSPRVTLLTISFSLLKSVMYGILLWLPAYFYSIGLVDYSLYIPMTFDGASIIGSTLLGAIFKRLPPSKKNLALIPVLFFLMIFFIMLKAIDFSVTGYFIIIGLVGLCLGGSYNTMAGLVTMQLVRGTPAQMQTNYLRFYSALLMAIANTITAMTQIIISYTVGEDEGALFGIFVVYTGINLCSMVGVAIIESYTLNSSNQQILDSKTTLSVPHSAQVYQPAHSNQPQPPQNSAGYQQIEITQIK